MTTEAAAAQRPSLNRWIIPLMALAVFINYVDRGNLPTAAPLMKDQLDLSAFEIGILISAFFWTYMPFQILAGWLAERINPYRTMAFGVALWSVATALMGVAGGFTTLLLLRLLLGLGETAVFPCSSKVIAQHVAPEKLGFANSLISQGLSLGPAFGTLIGGFVMAAYGWRAGFLIFGLSSLLWLIPWRMATAKQAVSTSTQAHAAPQAPPPPFGAILARRELWGAGLGHFACNFGFYFVISWLPLYLVKVQGYSMKHMAWVGASIYVTYAAGALLSGQLTDRWMAAGATPNLARKTLIAVPHAIAAAALAACGLGQVAVVLPALYLASLALGMISTNVFAIPQTLAGPRGAGKWVGVQNALGNAAGIVGPLIAGWLVDHQGFGPAFLVTAAVTALGVIGWGVIIPRIAPIDWDAEAAKA